MRHEQHTRPGPSERRAGRGRRARAGRRADRGAQGTDEDLRGACDAGVRAAGGRVAAPATAGGRREGDQRAVRHHSRRPAGDRPQGGDRCRAEAAMILWWIGDLVLLLVVVPVVVYLLHGVLKAARSIVPSVKEIATVAAAGSKDLDAAALLLTTQDQVTQTVAGVANYGGSLDVILDDARQGER